MKFINQYVLACILLSTAAYTCQAFQQQRQYLRLTPFQSSYNYKKAVGQLDSTAARAFNDEEEANRLLDEFRTASGEIINPYQVLNVAREAQRQQIRESYRTLSRKYHPDGHRHKTILPGKCNNLDDVRDQWERIKLAYEILSDKRTRRRYDRHEMLSDPGAAMKRAAVTAVGKGFMNVGKGIFDMGAFAVKAAVSSGSKIGEVSKKSVEEPKPLVVEEATTTTLSESTEISEQ